MYFTLNLAFVNYFDEAQEDLGIPVSKNWDNPGTNFTNLSRNL